MHRSWSPKTTIEFRREVKSISNAFKHFLFGVLKIRMNETPAFHLDAYSTLHRKTLTHSLPFAWCVISFMTFFNTTALTEIFKRESCVSYLGRGFLKFFSLSVCFLTFRLSPWLSNLRLLVVEETSLVFDTRPHLISFEPDVEIFSEQEITCDQASLIFFVAAGRCA